MESVLRLADVSTLKVPPTALGEKPEKKALAPKEGVLVDAHQTTRPCETTKSAEYGR